jgi:hypothetical protein
MLFSILYLLNLALLVFSFINFTIFNSILINKDKVISIIADIYYTKYYNNNALTFKFNNSYILLNLSKHYPHIF